MFARTPLQAEIQAIWLGICDIEEPISSVQIGTYCLGAIRTISNPWKASVDVRNLAVRIHDILCSFNYSRCYKLSRNETLQAHVLAGAARKGHH